MHCKLSGNDDDFAPERAGFQPSSFGVWASSVARWRASWNHAGRVQLGVHGALWLVSIGDWKTNDMFTLHTCIH